MTAVPGLTSVAKLLHEAVNACGEHAVAASERNDYVTAREWKALAIELQALVRDSVELMARPDTETP